MTDIGQAFARASRRTVGIRSNAALIASLAFLAIIVGCAILGPALLTRSPDQVTLQDRLVPPLGTGENGAHYIFGTDALGRDMFARLVAGARVSLVVGVVVVLASAAVGTLLGLLAAFGGRRADSIIMRIADAQVAFPGLVFIIMMIAILGAGMGVVIAVLTFYGWMIFTRVVRAQGMQTEQLTYVRAAEVIGTGKRRLIKLYVLPLLISPLLTQGLLELARVILAEASLSYLGLGIQPPAVSWGLMVAENQRYMATAPWTVLEPGLAIALTVFSVNVVANWIVARRYLAVSATVDHDPATDALSAPALVVTAAAAEPEPVVVPAAAALAPNPAALVSVSHLTIEYATGEARVTAVRDVSFDIEPGQVVALVGESGSGKTTTAMALLDLLPPTASVRSGTFTWEGVELDVAQRHALRGAHVGYLYQDPARRLNPLMPVGAQITESMRHHLGLSRSAAKARSVELLDQVGIPEPKRRARQLPHQFSGGMAQRVMLAMVLGPEPELLIADEPTAALDVTVQAQILDLLAALRRERSLAILMISHDLGAVASLADRVLVMHEAAVVESGSSATIFGRATDPYTKALLAATPRVDLPRVPAPAAFASTNGPRP